MSLLSPSHQRVTPLGPEGEPPATRHLVVDPWRDPWNHAAARAGIAHQVAVVVGIGSYRRPAFPSLANAPRDAKAVAELLGDDYGFDLHEQGRLLLDDEANLESIRTAVRSSLEQASKKTRWLFYFAGHGFDAGGQGYLVPAGVRHRDQAAYLPLQWLLETCLGSPCVETLIILDACYAGHALIKPKFSDWLRSDPSADTIVRQLITAGQPEQPVWDDGGEGHSVFSSCLLDALHGWAGIHDNGTIRFTPLLEYLKQATAARLRELQRKPSAQCVLGGNLTGNRRDEFVFEATVPRIPAAIVEGTRNENVDQRRSSLCQLEHNVGRHSGNLRVAIRLAAQGLPAASVEEALRKEAQGRDEHDPEAKKRTFSEDDAGVRRQAAATLGALSVLVPALRPRGETEACDHGAIEPLLHLALRDSEATVRHHARRSLGRMPPELQSDAADRLFTLYDQVSPRQRRRIRQAIATMPAGYRESSPFARIRAFFIRAGLITASGWRGVVEHPIRRRLVTSLLLAPTLLYAGLGMSYYLGSPDGAAVAVRWGLPGLEMLPGIGSVAVVSDHTISELRDATTVTQERVFGMWLWLHDGMFGWGTQLTELLNPATAAVASWRLGDLEKALTYFEQGLAAGDPASVRRLAYVAMQDADAVKPAIELMVTALATANGLEEELKQSLAVVRDTRPEAVGPLLESFAERLEASAGMDTVALVETLAVLGSSDANVHAVALERALSLLQANRADPQTDVRIARAIRAIQAVHPDLVAGAVPQIVDALRTSGFESQGELLAILDLPESVDPHARQLALAVLAQLIQLDNWTAQLAAIEILGRQIAGRPTENREYVELLVDLVAHGPSEFRLAAAAALEGLPAEHVPQATVVQGLTEIITSNGDAEVRGQAIALVAGLCDADSAPQVVAVLIDAVREPDVDVRLRALEALAGLALRRLTDMTTSEPVLRAALDDRDLAVRQVAAAGLVLLADRLAGELGPALDGYAAEILSYDRNPGRARVMGRDLGTANPVAACLVARRILPWFRYVEPSHALLLREFLSGVALSGSETLAAFSPVITDLMTMPEAEEDAYHLVRSLGSATHIEGLVEPLLQQLRSGSGIERRAAAQALGLLALDRTDLTQRAEVLPALLRCLDSSTPTLRAACANGLKELGEAGLPAGDVMPATLLKALEDPVPEVRLAVARALNRWVQSQPESFAPYRARILRRLNVELRPDVRLALAGALRGAPAVAGPLIRLSGSCLNADDSRLRHGAVWALRDLGAGHAAVARASIEILNAYLPQAEDPFSVLLAIRDVGIEQPIAAAAAFAAMNGALGHENRMVRWSAVTNGLLPLVRARPNLAGRALSVLESAMDDGRLTTDRGLAGDLDQARIELGATVGTSEPAILWPRLFATGSRDRGIGRLMLAHLAAARPDQLPQVRLELDERRQSLRPHIRQSAAVAAEMLTVLQKTESYRHDPDAGRRWIEILEWLPIPELDGVAELARSRGDTPSNRELTKKRATVFSTT